MLDALKQELASALCRLQKENFYILNQESMTVCDRANSLLVTHPVHLQGAATADAMLITDAACNVIEGDGDACTTLPAHLELYRAFPQVGAIIHSHGLYTTAWAQAGRNIPVYGIGHLEHFAEAIPCTRALTSTDVENGYSVAVGSCIAEMFQKNSLDPEAVPAALVFQHGAYVWGKTAEEAVLRCIALENIAHLAFVTEKINPSMVDTRVPITAPEQFSR